MKKRILSIVGLCMICAYSVAVSAASLIVCEKEHCTKTNPKQTAYEHAQKINDLLLANPNGRLDMCDASPAKHLCTNNAIYWNVTTDTAQFKMAIPNARIHVVGKEASLDYLISANNSYPRCMFSPVKIQVTPQDSIQIISEAYNCNLMETEPTNLQKSLLVDFIDIDHGVVGGQYLIQSGGALHGEAKGYALMQFRDANTNLPLVAKRYRNKAPNVPTVTANSRAAYYDEDPLAEQQDWWDSVKETWQAIKETADITPKEPAAYAGTNPDQPQENEHWWKTFTRTFMKVIYLEPLN